MKAFHVSYAPVLLMAALLIMASGCKKDKEKRDQDLTKIKWSLEYLQNTGTKVRSYFPSAEPQKISIIFTDSLSTLLFSGICNNGSGTYTYSAATGELSIHDLKLTLILCNNVVWENYTAQNLLNARRYEIRNDSLTIFSSAGSDLHFSRR
jgi:heat shock protein HslJ